MAREIAPWAGEAVQSHLDELLRSVGKPAAYRAAMQALGDDLGRALAQRLSTAHSVLLVCTVEDADFLARAILRHLERPERTVRVACFWNRRQDVGGREVAPIIRRYEEPVDGRQVDAVVVVKSIISGACVVRTNLTEVLEQVRPDGIIVVAPVMHVDAARKLKAEFSDELASRFEFLWCARDSERTADGIVVPGVGGSVYEHLGFGDEDSKNRVRPALVSERQERRDARAQG